MVFLLIILKIDMKLNKNLKNKVIFFFYKAQFVSSSCKLTYLFLISYVGEIALYKGDRSYIELEKIMVSI